LTRAVRLMLTTVLLASMLLSAAAEAGEPGLIARYVYSGYVKDVTAIDDSKVLLLVSGDQPRAVVLTLDPRLHVVVRDERWWPLPGEPLAGAVSPEGQLVAVAAAAGSGGSVVEVLDERLNLLSMLGVPAYPKRMFFVNDTLMVLASLSDGTSNVLYALAPGRLGWGEARILVGNLLPNRLENINPLQLVPVVYPDGAVRDAVLLYRVEPVKSWVLSMIVYAAAGNTTVPASGGEVRVYGVASNDSIETFMGAAAIGVNGTANVPIIPPQNFTSLVAYVFHNGSCYRVELPVSSIIFQAGIAAASKPVILSPELLHPSCPPPLAEYKLAYIHVTNTTVNVVDMPLSFDTSIGSLQLLRAYKLGDTLYLWLGGSGPVMEQLCGFTGNTPGFAVVPIKAGEARLEEARCYASVGAPTAASSTPDGGLVAVATSTAQVYLAARRGDGYQLIWAQRLAAAPVHVYTAAGENGYAVAAADGGSPGRLLVALAGGKLDYTFDGAWKALTLDSRVNALSGAGAAVYVATEKGLLVIEGALADPGAPSRLEDILVHNITLVLVDAVNGSSVAVEASYRLVYQAAPEPIVVLEGSAKGNGSILLPCGPGSVLEANITPLSAFYRPERLLLSCDNVRGEVRVELQRADARLVMRFVDSYTMEPPIGLFNVTVTGVDTGFNRSLQLGFERGDNTLVLQLPAGVYSVTVLGPEDLYMPYTIATVNVIGNTSLDVTLQRRAATVTIVLRATETSNPPDTLVVKVIGENNLLIYETNVTAPEGGKAELRFATLYRGAATLEVTAVPSGGAKASFYRNTSKQFEIWGLESSVELQLEPALYPLTVTVRAADTGERLASNITVLDTRGKIEIASAVNVSEATFNLKRGRYQVHIAPVPSREYMGFRLYSNKTIPVDVGPAVTLRVELERVREPTPVLIKDPFSLNNEVIDTVTIYLDGRKVYTWNEGDKTTTLNLPVKLDGSVLEVESKRNLYKPLKEKLKPTNKTVVVVLERKTFRITVKLLDDTGNPVGAATIRVRGLNLKYETQAITDDNGVALLDLPFGSYQFCYEAPGYLPECHTVTVQGTQEVSYVLKPQPITLVKRYMPLIIAVAISAALIAIVRYYFKRVVERLAAEEEF